MTKKMLSLALALMLCVAMVMPVYAESSSVTVVYNGVSYKITVEVASPEQMVNKLFEDEDFKAAITASGYNSLTASSVMVYDDAGDLIYAPSMSTDEAITAGGTYYLYLNGQDTVTNITQQEVDHRYPVTATYLSGSTQVETTYSVQIVWGTMNFTYTPKKTWDAENHVEISGGEWSSTSNTVTVSNHSNAAVTVKFKFESGSSYANVSGIFTGKQGTVTDAIDGVNVGTTGFTERTKEEMMETGITLAAGTNDGSPVTDVVVATLKLSGALTGSDDINQNYIIGHAKVMIDAVVPESDS